MSSITRQVVPRNRLLRQVMPGPTRGHLQQSEAFPACSHRAGCMPKLCIVRFSTLVRAASRRASSAASSLVAGDLLVWLAGAFRFCGNEALLASPAPRAAPRVPTLGME